MHLETEPAPPASATLPPAEAEVVAFLRGRSAPCPRCSYDLRDIPTATCPECGEPLVLRIGSARVHFGWLVLAMAPGCFSGVAALFVAIPVCISFWRGLTLGDHVPYPIAAADAFGFLSAISVVLMYRHRHRILAWSPRRQGAFAAAVWGVHIVMFILVVTAMAILY